MKAFVLIVLLLLFFVVYVILIRAIRYAKNIPVDKTTDEILENIRTTEIEKLDKKLAKASKNLDDLSSLGINIKKVKKGVLILYCIAGSIATLVVFTAVMFVALHF